MVVANLRRAARMNDSVKRKMGAESGTTLLDRAAWCFCFAREYSVITKSLLRLATCDLLGGEGRRVSHRAKKEGLVGMKGDAVGVAGSHPSAMSHDALVKA